jgi:hypothetical protein
MLSGKRGSVSQAFSDLADEIRMNALMAAGVSTGVGSTKSPEGSRVNPIK